MTHGDIERSSSEPMVKERSIVRAVFVGLPKSISRGFTVKFAMRPYMSSLREEVDGSSPIKRRDEGISFSPAGHGGCPSWDNSILILGSLSSMTDAAI